MDLVVAAFLHPHERFGETWNGLAGEHRDGTFAGGRFEQLAVVQTAFVFDQHAVLRGDQRTGARGYGFDLDGPAADRIGADPGEADAGCDDDQERKPQLDRPAGVGGTVRGFGDKTGGTSPYIQWPSFDIVAQAMGGWMGITGQDAEHPVKVGGGAGDTVPGLFAAFGTMVALWHARATGEGQYVDVAMTDSILAMSELVVSQYSYRGVSPVPVGNGIPGVAPFGTVKVKDGVIVIAAPHDPQFHTLCRLVGMPELIADPRFANEASRWEHTGALTLLIETFTTKHTKLELRALFGGKVPFSPIYNAQEIFEDPHFATRQMLPEVEQPGSQRPVAVPGVPVKLSQTPGAVRHRAPMIGEHTRAVLADFGLPAAEVERLMSVGAVSAQSAA